MTKITLIRQRSNIAGKPQEYIILCNLRFNYQARTSSDVRILCLGGFVDGWRTSTYSDVSDSHQRDPNSVALLCSSKLVRSNYGHIAAGPRQLSTR